MKLLVDPSLLPYGKAGIYAGIQSFLHNPPSMNTFDTFDKVNPDVFLADINSVTEAVLKNIEERPALKVVFFEGEPNNSNKAKIEARFGNLYPFKSFVPMADLVDYSKSTFVSDYSCHIVSINNALPDFILSVDFPKCVKFRVFNDQLVNFDRYCGSAVAPIRKNIYKSSKLSISSGDNYYNSAVCDCFPIMPETVDELFNALETDHTEAIEKIKEEVYSNYNNFSALAKIFSELGYNKESNTVIDKLKDLK